MENWKEIRRQMLVRRMNDTAENSSDLSLADDGELMIDHFTQCLKCRLPVKIIAMPCSLQAAMTSESIFEPPG